MEDASRDTAAMWALAPLDPARALYARARSKYAAVMRTRGPGHDLSELECHDHGCLVYSDTETFLARGVAHLREGLDRGERAMYVQGAPPARMREQLAALGEVDELMRAGALELVSLDDVYADGGLDMEQQAAFYHDAIDRALADGFSGLRALADGTTLLAGGADVEGVARWETRADRIMAERPMSGMCCYDRRVVPADALALFAAVHPLECGAEAVSDYHVSSCPGRGLALSGSLDTFTAAEFEKVLDLARPDRDFTLDLSALQFVDHAGVLAITRRAGAGDDQPRMTITDAPPMFTRVAGLIGVPG
jgi:hypothetical protein